MSQEIQGFRFRTSTRVPYGEKVRLRFDRSGGSITAVCSDLSIEGMFVATRESRPVGTVVEFEIEGPEGKIARGLGDVVWNRSDALGPGRHAGMGLQFRYVDPASRDLIAAMVRRRNEEAAATDGEPLVAGAASAGADQPAAGEQHLRAGEDGSSRAQEPLLVTAEVVLADRTAGGAPAGEPAPEPAEPTAPRPAPGWLWPVIGLGLFAVVAVAAWLVLGGRGTGSEVADRPGAAAASSEVEAPGPPSDAGAPEVASITLESSGPGTAVIALSFREAPDPSRVRVSRLDSPPRLLVRVGGADGAPGAVLDTPLVRGVESRVENEGGAPELHLVLELSGAGVRADWRFEGERLLLRLMDE